LNLNSFELQIFRRPTMKTIIFGALALAFAVPAAAQTAAPAADPHAGHAQHQAADPKGGQQHLDHAKQMAEMHKHCQEMMKHHGKRDHGAKPGATGTPAAGGHAGHHGN
jgi:hypothetical protein